MTQSLRQRSKGGKSARVQELRSHQRWSSASCVGEREDVSSVHTLLSGVLQVCRELLFGEEEEKVKEQGRQEDREVESGDQGEEKTLTLMAMMMVVSEVRTKLELEPM